jgi:hypothetical protein
MSHFLSARYHITAVVRLSNDPMHQSVCGPAILLTKWPPIATTVGSNCCQFSFVLCLTVKKNFDLDTLRMSLLSPEHKADTYWSPFLLQQPKVNFMHSCDQA